MTISPKLPGRHHGGISWSRTQIDLRSEEILVDAYNEAEQLGSFECVLDEFLSKPIACEVLGRPAQLPGALAGGHGVVLQGEIRVDGTRHLVDLLEVDIADSGAELGLSLAAYERWARTH